MKRTQIRQRPYSYQLSYQWMENSSLWSALQSQYIVQHSSYHQYICTYAVTTTLQHMHMQLNQWELKLIKSKISVLQVCMKTMFLIMSNLEELADLPKNISLLHTTCCFLCRTMKSVFNFKRTEVHKHKKKYNYTLFVFINSFFLKINFIHYPSVL